LIDENGVVINEDGYPTCHKGLLRNFLEKGVYTLANGMLIKKAAIPYGGYDESLSVASDFDFILRVLNTKNSFYYTAQKLSKYRKHSLSLTACDYVDASLGNVQGYINILEDHPVYARQARRLISGLYLNMRYLHSEHLSYLGCLFKAVLYDFLNLKTWVRIFVYCISFKKIKL